MKIVNYNWNKIALQLKQKYEIKKKILCDPPPRVMEIKTKVDKWDLINLKRNL